MTAYQVRRLCDLRSQLGEGPHYDGRSNTAWWLDIVGMKLVEHRFENGETIAHDLPKMASVVARIDEERQLLAMEDGLHVRRIADGSLDLLVPLDADNPGTRSNDGRVHPSGSLWIGTMGKNGEKEAGAIHWSDGTRVQLLVPGVSIPNAICFSPDGGTAYFADTGVNTVWRMPLDKTTGLPDGEAEKFLTEIDLAGGGYFDGMVVDRNGVLWNATWGAGCLSGFAPDGRAVRKVPIPAMQSSCPCFVGPALDSMIVTSAWNGYDDAAHAADPGAGYTYLIEGGFEGVADTPFRLL